jgi:hypothetical protein
MPYKDADRRRAYQRANWKKYRDPKRTARAVKVRNSAIRKWFRELKATLHCKDCGENHPACLQFHHRRRSEKTGDMATLLSRNWSRQRILEEVAKCDVLCANCHAKLHWNERNGSSL